MIRFASDVVYRRGLVLLQVVVLMGLLLVGSCGRSDSDGDTVAGVPLSQVSAPIRELVLWQREAFEQVPMNTAAEDVREFYRLRQDLMFPESRAVAEDSLWTLLSGNPDHLLWIEAVFIRSLYIKDLERYEPLFARAVSADSSSAVALYISSWQNRRHDPQAEDAYFKAGERSHELDPLSRVWLEQRQALLDSRRGRNLKALTHLEDTMKEAWAAGGLPLAACWWFNISKVTRRLGWLDDALVAAQLAVECASRDGDTIQEIRGYLSLGRVHQDRAEYTAAATAAMTSQQLAVAGGHNRWAQDASRLLANIFDSRGDLNETLAQTRKLRAMSMAAADTPSIICADLGIALYHMNLGDADSAYIWLDHAEELNAAGTWHEYGIRVAFLRWGFYLQDGKFAQADSVLASVQGIIPAKGRRQMVFEMIEQGFSTGRPDLIYRSIEQARRDSTIMINDPNFNAEQDLAHLAARFHARQGEFQLAMQELAIAAELVSAGTSLHGHWDHQDCRGRVAELSGDLEGAIEHHRSALEIATRMQVPNLQDRSRICLGELLIQTGQVADARRLFAEVQETSEYWTRLTTSLLLGCTEAAAGQHEQALLLFETTDAYLQESAPVDLRARLQLEKARSLIQLGRDEEAIEELEEVDLVPGAGVTGMSSEVYRSFHRPLHRDIAELKINLRVSQGEGNSGHRLALETLAIAEASRWRIDPAGPEPDAAAIEELSIAPGSPILAYFVGRDHIFCWVGTADGWSVVEIPDRDGLLNLIQDVQTDMESPDRPVNWGDVRDLSRILLDPVDSVWAEDATLYLVAPGPMAGLAWPAMPLADVDPEETLAIQRGPLVHLTSMISGPVVTPLDEPMISEPSFLALGVDDPGQDNRLKYAENEARAVAELWRDHPVMLLTGENAAWSRIKAMGVGQFSVIHVASHAVVSQGLPGCSTLRLAGSDTERPITIPEVRALDLDADLVFLSCCEGARLGMDRGSGLDSFTRAFQQAGARSVIASTNRVDDEAARELALEFYRHREEGRSQAVPLRSAQLLIRGDRSKWEHPFYWAYYQLHSTHLMNNLSSSP